MAVLQGSPSERDIYLEKLGVAATGVLPTDVVCKYRKEGASTLTTKTLDSTSWVELGSGFYVLHFTAAEMDTLGTFFYTLNGPKFDNFLYDDFTIEPAPLASTALPPNICVVNGTVKNVGGSVSNPIRVSARLVEAPATSAGNLITADTQYTYVGVDGTFELALVQGSVVIFEIERTGIRAQITVPNTPSASILDLLPPIPLT